MNFELGFQPLYRQVYNNLLARISEGYWKPGESLPSEYALAKELGVSQGTVRSALNVLEAESIVFRRQGKGTYVSEQTTEASIFRFFRLTTRNGRRLTPSSKLLSIRKRAGKRHEKEQLELDRTAKVIEMKRSRLVEEANCIAEDIILPESLFDDVPALKQEPESLYPFYQSYFGIHIIEVKENLSATLADKELARRLGIAVNSPLLKVERAALTIDKKTVEWRTSYIDTTSHLYSVEIS